jgi:hypothetical protein
MLAETERDPPPPPEAPFALSVPPLVKMYQWNGSPAEDADQSQNVEYCDVVSA